MIPDWLTSNFRCIPVREGDGWAVGVRHLDSKIYLELGLFGGWWLYVCDGSLGETPRAAIIDALRRAHRAYLDDLDGGADVAARSIAHAGYITALTELYSAAPASVAHPCEDSEC